MPFLVELNRQEEVTLNTIISTITNFFKICLKSTEKT